MGLTPPATRQVSLLNKPTSDLKPNCIDYLENKMIDLVINVRDSHADDGSITDGYLIRRKAVDFSVCLLTDVKLALLCIQARARSQ